MQGFTCKPSPTLLIDLSQDTDSLLSNMGKTCRNQVHKAVRKNLVVSKSQDYQAFFDLYRKFVKSKGFNENLDNFWSITEHGTLYTCHHEGSLIAGFLTLEDPDTSRWQMSGSIRLSYSDSKKRNLIGLANRALVWEAMTDAKARGKTWFDFGGIYTGEDRNHPESGIARFKRDFGGEEVTQYKYSRVYSPWLKPLKKLKNTFKNRALLA